MSTFNHIVVATDFSDSASKALDLAISLAVANDAQLSLVHVFELQTYTYAGTFSYVDIATPLEAAAQETMKKALADVRARHPRTDGVVLRGIVWEDLLLHAKKVNADLIVLGTHGRRGVERALVGSVAEKVVRMSPIPVLTVHGGA
jgi:nucleotide-binding universal stress UspA family protein